MDNSQMNRNERHAEQQSPWAAALAVFTFSGITTHISTALAIAASVNVFRNVFRKVPLKAKFVEELKNPITTSISIGMATGAAIQAHRRAQKANAMNEEIADERNAAMQVLKHEGITMRRKDKPDERSHVERLAAQSTPEVGAGR